MEKEQIEELKRECQEKETYTAEEVKTLLKPMMDETAFTTLFRVGRIKGYREKKTLTWQEVFKMVYICLEMTHDPKLQADPERVVCLITKLEREYL